MINRILSNTVKALSNVELIQKQSEEELKDTYLLIQVVRILVVIVWIFSNIISYFVGNLLNSNSSILEWSINHKYLVMITLMISLYTPATIIFFISSSMEPITKVWHQNQSSQILSPRNVWIATALISFMTVPFLVFIISFSRT